MDGLEDGLNLCFQEKNDLEQYTRKSSIRITGLDDHDKDENIEEWSSFITYWVPFSIFLFLQASSLCFLDINRTITGLFCLGRNGPKRWAMLISDSFISIFIERLENRLSS
jgi:hypothetical protein